MEYSNIGYHTRLNSDNTKKIVGGSFGGSVDIDTVNRLVNAHFTVKIKPSGIAVFVDKNDNEVNLYFNIAPNMSEKGKQAILNHRKELAKNEKEEEKRQEKLNNLLDSMSYDEIINRLES